MVNDNNDETKKKNTGNWKKKIVYMLYQTYFYRGSHHEKSRWRKRKTKWAKFSSKLIGMLCLCWLIRATELIVVVSVPTFCVIWKLLHRVACVTATVHAQTYLYMLFYVFTYLLSWMHFWIKLIYTKTMSHCCTLVVLQLSDFKWSNKYLNLFRIIFLLFRFFFLFLFFNRNSFLLQEYED